MESLSNFKKEQKLKEAENKKLIKSLKDEYASKLTRERLNSDRSMKRVIRQSESELRALRLDHQQKLIELNKEKNNLIADLNRQNETEKICD